VKSSVLEYGLQSSALDRHWCVWGSVIGLMIVSCCIMNCVCLYSRNVAEGCTQAVPHLMDIVPLLFGDRGTNIVSCHLCLIKQPLKDKQGGCREQKSVLALMASFRRSKSQVHVNLPLICLVLVIESRVIAMLTGLLWFSIMY
jgi:hypothetical protein